MTRSTYKIEYNGKAAKSSGENASEALEKYKNRMVFGNPTFSSITINNIDADTNGKEWARARAITGNGSVIVTATRID